MKSCNKEGCENKVFGGGYCKSHQHLRTDGKAPKPLNRMSLKVKMCKSPLDILHKDKALLNHFNGISNINGVKSQIISTYCRNCAGSLYYPLRWANLHHVFPKSTHPELRWDVNNIIILCLNCHNQVETYPNKMSELYKTIEEAQKAKITDASTQS